MRIIYTNSKVVLSVFKYFYRVPNYTYNNGHPLMSNFKDSTFEAALATS